MKTTLKSFSIPTPDGEEVFYTSDFATKEEAAKVEQELKESIASNIAQVKQSLSETNNDLSSSKEAIAYAIDNLRKAVGADNELQLSFSNTKFLNDCTSVKDALVALDAAIATLFN